MQKNNERYMWYEDDNFVRVIVELDGVGALPETSVVSRFSLTRAVNESIFDLISFKVLLFFLPMFFVFCQELFIEGHEGVNKRLVLPALKGEIDAENSKILRKTNKVMIDERCLRMFLFYFYFFFSDYN